MWVVHHLFLCFMKASLIITVLLSHSPLLQSALVPDQVVEILKRCLASKTLKYFRIDCVNVPKDLDKDKEGKDMIEKLTYQFNIVTIDNVFYS